jgi:hypothetical protein
VFTFYSNKLFIPRVLFDVILCVYYWYFVISWKPTGIFTLQMSSDICDGFDVPSETPY